MRPLFKLVFETTRTITSSASRSAKRMPLSFRSNPNSAAQQSVNQKEEGGLQLVSKSDSDCTRTTSTYIVKDGNTRSTTTMKRGGTTDYMITRNDDSDGHRIFHRDDRDAFVTRNAESDDGLQIDRRSSHTFGEEEEEGKETRRLFVLPPATPESTSEPPRGEV